MGDISRESSAARSSRRRRWEVNTKESFETGLAVELASPYTNELKHKDTYEPQSKSQPSSTSPKKITRPRTGKGRSSKSIPKIKSFKCENVEKELPKDEFSEKFGPLVENKFNDKLSDDKLDKRSLEAEASAPPLEQTPEPIKPPRKARRKGVHPIDPSCSQIAKSLNKLNEDVVISNGPGQVVVPVSGIIMDPFSSLSSINNNGGHISTIYCEKLNNFVLTKKASFQSQGDPSALGGMSKISARAAHALFLHAGFGTFSLLLQGLLAGITVAHLIFVLLFGADLIPQDAFMQTFFALIIFLTSVSLVSAFDKCDVAGHGVFFGNGIHFPWTPLFYLISLILSLIMIRAEDFFSNYQHLSSGLKVQGPDFFTWWRNLCIARTCFAVLGWIAIAADPHEDALLNRINELN